MQTKKEGPRLRSLAEVGLLDRSVVEEGGSRRGIWEVIREQRKRIEGEEDPDNKEKEVQDGKAP